MLLTLAAMADERVTLKGSALFEACLVPDHRFAGDVDVEFHGNLNQWREVASEIVQLLNDTGELQLELELLSHESTSPIDLVALTGEIDGEQVELPIDAVVLAARAGTPTQDWPLYPSDPDVSANVTIRGHSVEMAAAEKLTCIPRKEMKDIFDIRRLLAHYELAPERVYELAVQRALFNEQHGIRSRELDNLSTYFRKRRKDFRKNLRRNPELIYPPLDAAEADAMLEFVADWLDRVGED